MNCYRAKFLVAIPELIDSNFYKSVVLMFHHDEDGASGLILNRPSPVSLHEVWDQISDSECDVEQPMYFGGPVDGQSTSAVRHRTRRCTLADWWMAR